MVVVLIVAVLTITAAQTPPPAIAEIAPSAVQQITESPPEQASSVGSAEGGGAIGAPETTTTSVGVPAVTQPPQFRPRTRACVPNGDGTMRQTEDPQSPPCVPFFEGPNGGATSKGVTADQITLVRPSSTNRALDALVAYFNKRFEFYGRKIVLKEMPVDNGISCTRMEQDATKADQELKGFASLNHGIQNGRERCYYDALARKGIISLGASFIGTPSTTEADMAKFHPYQWNYYPSLDRILAATGELTCNQMAGKPPAFAGAPTNAAPVRKFGLIVDEYSDGTVPPDPTPLLRRSQQCGVTWEVVRVNSGGFLVNNVNEAARAAAVLEDRGVTTVMCLCFNSFISSGGGRLEDQARANGWYPEWILQNFGKQDDEEALLSHQQDHIDHLLVLRSWNKALPRDQRYSWMAEREMDPTIPPNFRNYNTDYFNLLVFASGIQAAGPNLTPQTFAAGLQRTVFANPGCGGPNVYQACAGFQGDHTMQDDFVLGWWDRNQHPVEYDFSGQGADQNQFRRAAPGGLCYADQGMRYGIPGVAPRGSFPKLAPNEQPHVYGAARGPCR